MPKCHCGRIGRYRFTILLRSIGEQRDATLCGIHSRILRACREGEHYSVIKTVRLVFIP